MSSAVPGQERHSYPIQIAQRDSIAGITEGRLYFYFLHIGQTFYLIKPRAANYSDSGFSH
jgi:hypothetical protein